MSQIGDRVRALREQRCETQETVARRAGMSLSTYQRVELGYHNPQIRTLERVAAGLKVKPADLLAEDDTAA
ncbi:MAG TPA: helix-turn-helix transcriptional regulator [Trebonia sp.]|jgi:transcriptional regulator with XRE-family HTH domain|nr:helix-turn-helix transcriptional regulator [Trebonia sp.]